MIGAGMYGWLCWLYYLAICKKPAPGRLGTG